MRTIIIYGRLQDTEYILITFKNQMKNHKKNTSHCNESNTTGATRRAEIDYPSGLLQFIPGF
jgi:hypothetical protein